MLRLVLGVLTLLPAFVQAQKLPVVALGKPDASLDEEFTFISSVRELGDGRVIITDPRDRGIVVADLRTGRTESLSRKGQGPGEYTMAAPVLPLAGDSSIMPDMLSRRWLLFDGTRSVASMPPDAAVILATRGLAIGADSLGHVISYADEPVVAGARDLGKGDSSTVIRVARATGKVDTVARLRQAPAHTEIQTDTAGRVVRSSIRRQRLAVGEAALLFRDGWLAVTRIEPYRVDWRTADGHWVLGKPLPLPVIPMSAREKRASMERTAKSSGQPAKSPDTISDWPDVMPPYLSNGLVAGPYGLLLVQKQPSADYPDPRYDVVDRRGNLLGQLTLPANQRIVASGANALYVVAKDEDDIERLRRFAWPAEMRMVP